MKRALITSGGGAKGAFSVGALIHLITQRNLSFDLISGTSTGSFIAALIAARQLDKLQYQYLRVAPDDILEKQNLAQNLLTGKPYLFSSTPLNRLIDQYITNEVFDMIMDTPAPLLCITAVSLQTGIATVFNNKNLPGTSDKYKVKPFLDRGHMVNVLLASGSQAGFTPPVDIDGEQFVDGGHRDVIPSRVVVDNLPDEVYLLSNNPAVQFTVSEKYTDLINTIFRAITIFVQDVRENDLKLLTDYSAQNSKPLYVIDPAYDLDEENPTGLGFNPVRMRNWMNMGILRAKEKMDNVSGPPEPVIA